MQDFDPDEDAITGINVTPLVDITLVLLIIFMVTARFITEPSIGVNLPKTSGSSSQQAGESKNIFLSLDTQGRLFLNNKSIDRSELLQQVQALIKEKPDMNLVLRADRSIPHGQVMEVLDIVREAGVSQFGIAVEGKTPP